MVRAHLNIILRSVVVPHVLINLCRDNGNRGTHPTGVKQASRHGSFPVLTPTTIYVVVEDYKAYLAAESLQVTIALGLQLIQSVVRIRSPQMRPTAKLVDVRRYELSKEVLLLDAIHSGQVTKL